MQFLIWIPVILLLLAGLYVLAVRGRRDCPGLKEFDGHVFAHRGFHGEGRPENSMAAFRAAYKAGYGIELDVHLMKDGTLAVIHDASLKRTAGVDVKIEDLTREDLEKYYLEGTFETIPTFRQVLELYKGDYPMIVELKAVGSNHGALCQGVCDLLETYPGAYCVESFDPRCVHWLKKNRPDVIRGQLTENFFRSKTSTLPGILKFVMTHQFLNFLTLPDFVAYRFTDRKTLSNFLVRKVWGVRGVTWTLRAQEEMTAAKEEGWLPIFENFKPE